MFSVGFWQLFQQLANCGTLQTSDLFGSPAVLGSFGRSSMASRRKRGPVAFRLRLSAGLALSLFSVLFLYAHSTILYRRGAVRRPNDNANGRESNDCRSSTCGCRPSVTTVTSPAHRGGDGKPRVLASSEKPWMTSRRTQDRRAADTASTE